MMFFLARSALCIGVVAVAASGMGTGRLATAVDRGAREAVNGAARACLASDECLRAGTASLSAAAGGERVSRAQPGGPPPRRPEVGAIRRAILLGG